MKSLRLKLSERAQRELNEKNCVVMNDAEWADFMAQVFTISDCNETPDLVTPLTP